MHLIQLMHHDSWFWEREEVTNLFKNIWTRVLDLWEKSVITLKVVGICKYFFFQLKFKLKNLDISWDS